MTEELLKRLTNIKEKSPILLLGEAAKIFELNYSGEVITPFLINFEEFVQDYNYNEDKLLVLNATSYSLDTSILRIFLNRLTSPVIILSEDTHINEKQLSEIKTIIKYSNKSKSKLNNAVEAINKWKESDNKSNINRYYAEESPELYYLRNKSTMNKYIDLLSKC